MRPPGAFKRQVQRNGSPPRRALLAAAGLPLFPIAVCRPPPPFFFLFLPFFSREAPARGRVGSDRQEDEPAVRRGEAAPERPRPPCRQALGNARAQRRSSASLSSRLCLRVPAAPRRSLQVAATLGLLPAPSVLGSPLLCGAELPLKTGSAVARSNLPRFR